VMGKVDWLFHTPLNAGVNEKWLIENFYNTNILFWNLIGVRS